MQYRVNYNGTAEGQAKVVADMKAQYPDRILTTIEDITEGHFLVFETPDIVNAPSNVDLLAMIEALKQQNKDLQDQNITLMLAIADLYEAVAPTT